MRDADVLVVDIGAGTGALVAYAPAELDGAEIEIALVGSRDSHPLHNVVRPRRTSAGVVFAAVFPDLPAGDYQPHGGWVATPARVRVRGGEVTEVVWRPGRSRPADPGGGSR
jgi:hypothetical protein